MRGPITVIAAVVCLGVVFAGGFWAQDTDTGASETHPAQWQHLALQSNAEQPTGQKTSRQIVQLGNNGWELVDVENFADDGKMTKTVSYSKRPLQ